MDAELFGNLGNTLSLRWAHTPFHLSFYGLAVTTHCSAPSSPLVVKMVVAERRQLFWQRGHFDESLKR
jgi:hypothetical protein